MHLYFGSSGLSNILIILKIKLVYGPFCLKELYYFYRLKTPTCPALKNLNKSKHGEQEGIDKLIRILISTNSIFPDRLGSPHRECF